MPTYEVELDNGEKYHVEADNEPSHDEILSALGYGSKPQQPAPDQSTATGAFARGVGANIGKTTGIVAGATTGAEGGAYIGTAIGGPVGGAIGTVLGGLGGAVVGGFGGDKAQEAIQGEQFTQELNAQRAIDEQQYPWASRAGEGVSSIPTMFVAPELQAGKLVGPITKLGATAAEKAVPLSKAAHVANTALGGLIMGSGESGASLQRGQITPGQVPGQVLKSAVTMAPLGLVPGADKIAGSAYKWLGKPLAESAVAGAANTAYDAVTGEQNPGFVADMAQNAPGFIALNALGNLLHGKIKPFETGKPETTLPNENLPTQEEQPAVATPAGNAGSVITPAPEQVQTGQSGLQLVQLGPDAPIPGQINNGNGTAGPVRDTGVQGVLPENGTEAGNAGGGNAPPSPPVAPQNNNPFAPGFVDELPPSGPLPDEQPPVQTNFLQGIPSSDIADFLRNHYPGITDKQISQHPEYRAAIDREQGWQQPSPVAPPAPAPVPTPAPSQPDGSTSIPPVSGPQTAIKNDQTDIFRVDYGLGAREKEPAFTDKQAVEAANQRIAANPNAVNELVDELRTTPRPHTSEERVMLSYAMHETEKAHDEAAKAKIAADATGDLAQIDLARERVEQTKQRFLNVIDASEKSGRASGQSLASRRWEDKAKGIAPNVETFLVHETARIGRPLKPEEEANLRKLHKEYFDNEQKIEKNAAAAQETETAKAHSEAFKQDVKDVQKEESAKTSAQRKAEKDAKRAAFIAEMDRRADEALKSFRAKMGNSNSDFAALAALPEVAQFLAAKLAKGGVKLAQLIDDLVTHFGITDKAAQQQAIQNAKKLHDQQAKEFDTTTPESIARNAAQAGKVDAATIKELYKAHIRENLGKPSLSEPEILKRVHADVAKVEMGIKTTREDQLTDARKAVETRLRNQWRDLVDTLHGKVQPRADRKPIEWTPEMREMKNQIQELHEYLADLTGPNAETTWNRDQQKAAIAAEKYWKIKNETKDFGRAKSPFEANELTKRAREQAEMAKQEFMRLRESSGLPAKEANEREVARMQQRQDELKRQLKEGEPHGPNKPRRPMSPEAQALKAENDRLSSLLDWLRPKDPKTRDKLTPEQRTANAEKAAERTIAQLEREIAGEARARPDNIIPNAKLRALRAEAESLRSFRDAMRDAKIPRRTPEQIANEELQKRLRRSIYDLEQKLRTGDFSKKTREEIAQDDKTKGLLYEKQIITYKIAREQKRIEMANLSPAEKAANAMVGWRRAFLLSGYHVLGKLSAAAMARHLTTPLDEMAGSLIKRIPGVSEVAAKAPRHGQGFSYEQEAKAITDGVMTMVKNAGKILKTGQTPADAHSGKPDFHDLEHFAGKPVAEFFGNLHVFLKSSAKEAEFSRSLQKRMAHELALGNDPHEPYTQTRLMVEAYKDAKAAVFQQENFFTTAWKSALRTMENYKTNPTLGKAAAKVGQIFLPITHVPTNFAAEAINRTPVGIIRGALELKSAIKNGLDTLHPDEADKIMRHLKQGTVGTGLLLLGYLAPQIAGGYYQAGEKRKKDELGPGDIGAKHTHFLMHNPAAEVITMGATVRKVADHMLKGHPEGFIRGMAQGYLGMIGSTPFLRSPSDIATIANGRRSEQTRVLGSLAQGLTIPRFVTEIAQDTDTVEKRKTRELPDYLKAGIPGLRQTLPPVRVH